MTVLSGDLSGDRIDWLCLVLSLVLTPMPVEEFDIDDIFALSSCSFCSFITS